MAKAEPEEQGQIKAREEHNRITTVASIAVDEVKADLWKTKRMARKRHGRAGEARRGKYKARKGHDRIMAKKDKSILQGYMIRAHCKPRTRKDETFF